MSNLTRQIAVYYPSTQHSLLLARTLVQEGYDTCLLTRYETESALRQSASARLAYKALGQSHIMRRAIENRSADGVRGFSTDPRGVLLGRLIRETLGRPAAVRFGYSRMRHSARSAGRLMSRHLRPDLVIAAETGALELLEELRSTPPVVIDVAHPHPKEVDRCRRLAAARYPGFAASWDDPPLAASGWRRLDRALTRATRVWTASRYTAESIRAFVAPSIQIDVVGYGVAGVPRESPASGYRGRYLFVGSAGLRKGVPLLLQAWARSGLAGEGCVLDLVGRKLDSAIETAVSRTAGVRRHTDVCADALTTLFQQADALVSPSYCEGFGRVLIEAASIGLPFLATRTGAVDDILGAGLGAWCVDVDDVDGFTGLLLRFHRERTARGRFIDGIAGLREHWTQEAYGSRLRSALERCWPAAQPDAGPARAWALDGRG
jgi:glycosyltransferase involved in cell wall biosynthesis